MKLLTNKRFQGEINKATKPLNDKIEELNKIISNKEFRYLEEADKLKNEIQKSNEMIESKEELIEILEVELYELNLKYKKAFGAKGGLIKQINKLQEQLNEAEIKLSQRFILKELKPQKAKNMQVMRTKSSSRTSKIIKKVVAGE